MQAEGKFEFPKIPGINTPFFGARLISANNEDVEKVDVSGPREDINSSHPASFFFPGHHHYSYYSNLANVIPVPNITALLLSRNITNATNVIIVPIAPLPNIHKFFPGPDIFLYHARKHLAEALGTSGDPTIGIQNALQRAFMTNDPAAAINTLIQTILNVYGSAIRNCPFAHMCAKLASEAAYLVRQVIVSIMSATVVPSAKWPAGWQRVFCSLNYVLELISEFC